MMFARAEYEFSDSLSFFTQGYFTRAHSETVQQPAPAGNQWGVIMPYGNDTFTGSLTDPNNPGSATRPEYLSGGRLGLNCGPTGGCTNSQVFPVPGELATLLNSRGVPLSNPDGSPVLDANGLN